MSKSPSQKLNRAVDRSFKNHKSPKAGRHLNFFPLAPVSLGSYARADVYHTTRCVREEKVTLHIPQDRLDAARFDGLTIILLDQTGAEVPVYLPPNYIEGFRKAVQGYSAGATYQGQTQPSSYGQPAPVPYGSGGSYPLNDSSPSYRQSPQGSYPQP